MKIKHTKREEKMIHSTKENTNRKEKFLFTFLLDR